MGHFGILELALFNSNQDSNDSNIHPCCLIRYSYQFLQCLSVLFFFFLMEKTTTTKTATYFSFGMKNANMKSSKQKET